MSYILDALRRADAEREGASIHGGFGQAHSDEADDADLPAPASPWVWMMAGMLLVVLAGVFWRWVVMDASAPVPVVPVTAAEPPVAVPQMPPVAVAPPAVIAQETPSVMAAAVAPVSPPESRPIPRKPVVDPPAATPRLAERVAAHASPAPERPPASEARVYQLNELPDDVRRQLPRLTVGGAMYSDKPASRMVIFNGQLFHEGDALTPTVSLRQIKLKSAVLEFKGFRYELNY